MLLSDMISKQRIIFAEQFADWRSAVRHACSVLLADGSIQPAYVQAIIDSIEKHGAYIVIAPDIAMPHAQGNAETVARSVVSFMKVERPVIFDADDRSKDARLFFTLAAQDSNSHLENMAALAEMLDNEALIADLLAANQIDDLRRICAQYHI